MKKRVITLALSIVMLATCLGAGMLAPTPVTLVDENGAATTSEIVQPTVNYTDVAPFLPPVSGEVRMLRAASFAAPRAAANDAANYAANDTAADNGMVINKTATANGDGSYTITLEAYATGEKVITEQKTDKPTDIILVLDQSGSMDETMSTYDFRKYTGKSNSDFYDLRHNGAKNPNLYHKLDDDSYATVSVSRVHDYSYKKYSFNNTLYYANKDYLYVKNVDGYQKVTLTRDRDGNKNDDYVYTYKFPNENTFVSYGKSTKPGNFDGNGPLYVRSKKKDVYTYTYTYTGKDGNPQTIGTSTGANTQPTDFTLYERYQTGSKTRLEALKTAVTNFTDEVAKKAKGADGTLGTNDDVNHRIAVVGFASESGSGNNTELLSISGNNSGDIGVAYNSITNQDLKNVVQSMDTTEGQQMVTKAINALAANGATRADLGMDMAKRILNQNPVPQGEKRNRVVIVFTDGSPTDSKGFEINVANDAISTASEIKTGGATVYSIGIFSGADASSAGTEPNADLAQNSTQLTAACNWFMQKLSSNNGKVQTPSYYLSAADADALNSIFEQISDQIEIGGSSSTLTNEAVVKDIISPQFTLPAGTTDDDITLETYACTGKNGSDYIWNKNADAMGASATVNGDTVSVTGFNFSENWVGTETNADGTTYHGNKLVISFDVSLNKDFLGGNNVATNSRAGVYKDSTATDPALLFPQPTVDIPIGNVSVTANDKNVYLLQDLTKDDLFTVEVGDVRLKLTEDNYGLEPWQTEYVDIKVVITDKDNKEVTDLTKLTDDQQYTATVTVSPKYGVVDDQSTKRDKATANVNVFKPEITFQDSTINLGQTPDYATDNYVSVVWKHGDKNAKDADMTGSAPDLSYTYSPAENDTDAFKTDTYVKATVKIGETPLAPDKDVTFKHNDCSPDCGFDSSNGQFIVHINTFDLTITKSITGYESRLYGSQDFVFNVKCEDKNIDIDVVVNVPDEEKQGSVTIKGLPVGTYTITENTGWSWRYELQGAAAATGATGTVVYNNDGSSAKYTPSGTNNEIVFTNSWVQAKWLSFTDSWKNIFREPNT